MLYADFSAWTAGNTPSEEFSVVMGDVEIWFQKDCDVGVCRT